MKGKKEPQISCACRKGRSAHLLQLRDIKLLTRFYQLSEVKRLRTDDVLLILSTREFFISEQRIWNIIRSNTHLLDALSRGENIDPCPPAGKQKEQLKLFE